MDIVGVILLVLLGGAGLFVGLILAIVTGSARSERLRRLENEQANLRAALNEAATRVQAMERALGETMLRLSSMRMEAPEPRPAPAPAPAPPAAKSEAPVAATDPELLVAREPRVAEPPPAAVEVTIDAAAPDAPAPAAVEVVIDVAAAHRTHRGFRRSRAGRPRGRRPHAPRGNPPPAPPKRPRSPSLLPRPPPKRPRRIPSPRPARPRARRRSTARSRPCRASTGSAGSASAAPPRSARACS